MKRFKEYSPDQVIINTFNADEEFPDGTFERYLVTLLKDIDINNFYEKEDKGGEAPFNPRSMLGIIFYAIINGLFSLRKMEFNAKKHHGFMYVSGFVHPDHSTIGRFIISHKAKIEDIFSQIVYIAQNKGFIDKTMFSIDGTKIEANAANKFTGTIEDFKKKKIKIGEKIQKLISKIGDNKKEDAAIQKRIKKYENDKNKISSFLVDAKKIYNKSNKEKKQNITDNDCRTMKFKRGYTEGYNAQSSVDAKGNIIVSAIVKNNENDKGLLEEMHADIKKECEYSNIDMKDSKLLADNGYHTTSSLLYAHSEKIDVYIPEGTTKDFYKDKKSKNKKEIINFKSCTLTKNVNEIYLECPGGAKIKKYLTFEASGAKYISFRVNSEKKCNTCSLYEKCKGGLQKPLNKKFDIDKQIFDNWEVLTAYSTKMKTDKAKFIYSNRVKVERPYANIKEIFNIKRFYRRGLEKAQITWKLVCAAYNIKTMFRMEAQYS